MRELSCCLPRDPLIYEKNELNIEKSRHDLNDLINLAISHLSLIVESKNGKITLNIEDSI